MIPHEVWDVAIPQFFTAFVNLSMIADHIAKTVDLLNAQFIQPRQYALQCFEIPMNI